MNGLLPKRGEWEEKKRKSDEPKVVKERPGREQNYGERKGRSKKSFMGK